MKKLMIFIIVILCLALPFGSASSQQAGGIIGGGWSDETPPEPVPTVEPGPRVIPEGKFLVDGELSDAPPEPSQPAAISTPAPFFYQDGMPNGENQGEALVFPEVEPGYQPDPNSFNGTPNYCVPHSLIQVNFDEQSQPTNFSDAVALRYEYRSRWVTFNGPAGNDGGAILDEGGNFGVSGYSAPNFLAFNSGASLIDGGVPRPPEYIYFFGKAVYVELLVGSKTSAGQTVTIEAFNDQNHSLGSTSTTLAASMKKLSLGGKGIYRLDIRTSASVLVVDNLAYLPQAYPLLVDFDNTSAPDLFINTTALRSEYWIEGSVFTGPASKDGGAILNKNSNFAVTGFSDPNFLAFNSTLTMSDSGIPRPPETITFQFPVSSVQIYAGTGLSGSVGKAIQLQAFDTNGNSLGMVWRNMDARLRPLTLNAAGIQKLVITSDAARFVMDDLIFVKQSSVTIDFDESSQPRGFDETTALRNTYISCWTVFNGPAAKDGGAVLDQDSNFMVSNFTAPNFLAFNSEAHLNDDGHPIPPEELVFQRPVDSLQFSVGSNTSAGSNITLQVYDKNNLLIGSRTLTLQPKLQTLGYHHSGITRAVISSPAAVFVIDSFNIHFAPLNYLPVVSKVP